MPFDIAVVIGRFAPFHWGHYSLIQQALEQAKHVIVLLGSANRPRSIQNPWLATERQVMIEHSFNSYHQRLHCLPLNDRLYNDQQWAQNVQQQVGRQIETLDLQQPSICLVGHDKDASSYYLKMFPQWPFIGIDNQDGLSGTRLRQLLLEQPDNNGNLMLLEASVPKPVFALLQSFQQTQEFAQLVREFDFIRQYQAAWAVAPYPPTFVTVDAVVIHSGHLLLVRRRAEPGKGLWALPGGFVNAQESLQQAVIRELREETRLKLPTPVLIGSIKASRVFDHPQRSARGRTITHAYLFEFPFGGLPAIKGGDDADKARWLPLADLSRMENQLFEDHADIAQFFLGTI